MSGVNPPAERPPLALRTPWIRDVGLPVRTFLRTESGGALVLLGAALAAVLWANLPGETYERFWGTELSLRLGERGITEDLHTWVTDGLMTFFFLVIGLELRREFDVGDLRQKRRVAIPVLAGLGGMVVPAAVYLAIAGAEEPAGWAIPVATDTAFALGVLALVAGPSRLRVFLLTLVVVDDLAALLVIAVGYTDDVDLGALALAVALFGVILAIRFLRVWRGPAYLVLGVAAWAALHHSGVHPTILGVAVGLLAAAYPPPRQRLELATRLLRAFREQPTPELARAAQLGVQFAISPNERIQYLFHPWTSYVIVPLFALANAGVELDPDTLSRAASSPVALGVLLGLVVGKPVGITVAALLAGRLQGLPLTISRAHLAGIGIVAGIGFTVSLFIAQLAFEGERLEEAKLGILGASIVASALGFLAFRAIGRLPARWAIVPDGGEELLDLVAPVDPERDHVRGPVDAPVTLLEYGDYECPYCGRAEPDVRAVLAEFGADLRYVFRHLPLPDVHPQAELAAQAAEAAGAQGRFWEMHDVLFAHQDALAFRDLVRYPYRIGIDGEQFAREVAGGVHAQRVAEDVEGAEASGVSGTPTFFVNGRRHQGAYTREGLAAAVRAALAASRP